MDSGQASTSSPQPTSSAPLIHFAPVLSQTQTQENRQYTVKQVEPSPADAAESNLIIAGPFYGTLYVLGDMFSQRVPEGVTRPLPSHQAMWMEIKNARRQGGVVGSASKIKAELIVNYGGRDNDFTPLPWIDQYDNTVNFKFGDVKFVVLAVRMGIGAGLGDWRVPLNHRELEDYSPGLSRLDFDRQLANADATLRLNLLQITTGKVLRSFAGTCKWNQTGERPYFQFDIQPTS